MEPAVLISRRAYKEPEVLTFRSMDRPGPAVLVVGILERTEPEVLIFRSIITRTEPEVIIFRSIIRPKPEVPRIPKFGKTGTGGSHKG
jgi:hypothetical protein